MLGLLTTVVSSWHDKLHHWNPQCWSAVARVVANTALKVVNMTVYKGVVKQPAHLTLGGPKGFSQKMLSDFPNEMRTFCKSQLHTISRLFSLRESPRSHAAMRQLSTVAHISTASEGFFSSPGSDSILITCVQQTEVTHRLPHQAEGSWLLIPKHFSQWQCHNYYSTANTWALQPVEHHNYHSKQKT